MKTFLLIALFPTLSLAFAGSLANKKDCGLKKDPYKDVSYLQKLICQKAPDQCKNFHNTALIGKESGRVVSSDPNTLEAQIAEASGTGVFCKRIVGTLNLVEYEGKKFLVGTAHGFYENGKLLCKNKSGRFFPDIHYGKNNPHGINYVRGYKFKMPPLNHRDSLKYRISGKNNLKLNDLVVLEVEDNKLFQRQVGGKRKFIRMADIDSNELPALSESTDLFIIGQRTNFEDYKKISYENGCQIETIGRALKVKRHNCDTGNGSSGTSLSFLGGPNKELYSAGIHYGGTSVSQSQFKTGSSGNYFIPSEYVLNILEKVTQR